MDFLHEQDISYSYILSKLPVLRFSESGALSYSEHPVKVLTGTEHMQRTEVFACG